MAEIPWWAWLGVGLFVSISSVYGGGKLTLFAWVGLLFIAIGIGKITFLFVLKPRETKAEQKNMHMPYPTQWQQAPQGLYCPTCRVTVQSTDFFCRYCGRRLR